MYCKIFKTNFNVFFIKYNPSIFIYLYKKYLKLEKKTMIFKVSKKRNKQKVQCKIFIKILYSNSQLKFKLNLILVTS